MRVKHGRMLLSSRGRFCGINIQRQLLTYAGNLSTLAPLLDEQNADYDAARASRFRFCKVDICDRAAVEKVFEVEKSDIVVNFAAESHVRGGSDMHRKMK